MYLIIVNCNNIWTSLFNLITNYKEISRNKSSDSWNFQNSPRFPVWRFHKSRNHKFLVKEIRCLKSESLYIYIYLSSESPHRWITLTLLKNVITNRNYCDLKEDYAEVGRALFLSNFRSNRRRHDVLKRKTS